MRANSKPWFLYTTLTIVSSMEWSNATSFNHCKVIIYTLQINIIYIKLMVDHEINEPHKPFFYAKVCLCYYKPKV